MKLGFPQQRVASGPRASPAFIRRLQSYDRLLLVAWNPEVNRWQIGRLRPGTSDVVDYVMTVANADGTYRPLDERVFERLRDMDLARRTIHQQLRDIDAHNAFLTEAAWKSGETGRRDLWRHMWARHHRGRTYSGPSKCST